MGSLLQSERLTAPTLMDRSAGGGAVHSTIDREHRSLDDYIHALQKYIGNAQAQRLRCLEVEDQLVLGRLLNRYVLRSFALKNSLHKFCTVANSSRAIGAE
jgi:hypothetical protein